MITATLTAANLYGILFECRGPGPGAIEETYSLSNTFDLGEAARRIEAFLLPDQESREVDEAPKFSEPTASWPNIGELLAVDAKAKQIVEAIRGYEDNSAMIMRRALEALRAKSGVGQIETMQENGRKLIIPYILSESAMVDVAQEFGFAGGDVAGWLRDKLEDWQRQRAHNVELTAEAFQRDSVNPKDRLDILTAIWNEAQDHGWLESPDERLDAWVTRQLRERWSKESSEATERARLNAIGELLIAEQKLSDANHILEVIRSFCRPLGLKEDQPISTFLNGTFNELKTLNRQVARCAMERDKAMTERDEARTQRDHVIRTMRQMRRRVGEIAEGAWE